MSKIDRGLELFTEGIKVDPVPPRTVPAGNYLLVMVTFDGDIGPLTAVGFLPGIVVGTMATGIIPPNKLQSLAGLPNRVRKKA